MSQINCIDGALANPGFQWVVAGASKPGFMHDAANSEIDFVINGVQSLVVGALGIVLPKGTNGEITGLGNIVGAWAYDTTNDTILANNGGWETLAVV